MVQKPLETFSYYKFTIRPRNSFSDFIIYINSNGTNSILISKPLIYLSWLAKTNRKEVLFVWKSEVGIKISRFRQENVYLACRILKEARIQRRHYNRQHLPSSQEWSLN